MKTANFSEEFIQDLVKTLNSDNDKKIKNAWYDGEAFGVDYMEVHTNSDGKEEVHNRRITCKVTDKED